MRLSLEDHLSLFTYSSAQLSFFPWLSFSHLITVGFGELILIYLIHTMSCPRWFSHSILTKKGCQAYQGYPGYVANWDLCIWGFHFLNKTLVKACSSRVTGERVFLVT